MLVLPQGIALAALAGLPPAYGLAPAVLPCIVAALFGSSRHVMSGPTHANSLALLALLAPLAPLAPLAAVGSPAISSSRLPSPCWSARSSSRSAPCAWARGRTSSRPPH